MKRSFLAAILAASILLAGCTENPDDQAVGGPGFGFPIWRLVSGNVQPISDSWNLKIPSISGSTQCLQADTNGLVSGTGGACGGGGGGGAPGGADTEIQFNASGSFDGNSGLTYNSTTEQILSTQASTTQSTTTYGYADKTFTAGGFIGPLTGNADTATALAANGANCSAGSAPLGVDASGAAESCTDYEEDLSNEAGLYAALSDVTQFWEAGDTITSGTWNAAAIDVSDYTNLAAGRSLTLSGDSVEADTELYTDTKCIWFEDPVAEDDFNSIWTANGFAATITKMWCESDQTVNMDLQVDDGTPADVNGTDLVCDSTPAEDEAMGGDATLADGDRLDLAVTSVSGTPTWVSICWTYTLDD